MEETYYSIKQISKMLGLHEKTLQRYIREGKLRAGKFGKQYRVSGDDLSAFTEAHGVSLPAEKSAPPLPKITVSAVVDIAVPSEYEADRIDTAVIAAANSKDPSYGHATVSVQRIDNGGKLRVLLWGVAAFVETMISMIRAYEGNE